MPRRVLVPMDDSAPALAALDHALEAVHADDVTVVHAVDDLEATYGGGGAPARTGEEPDFFDEVEAAAADRGRDVETVVLAGTPAAAILAYADEHDVDAIVMGSEGRSGVSRMLLGSVAEKVARRASVPVTIVR